MSGARTAASALVGLIAGSSTFAAAVDPADAADRVFLDEIPEGTARPSVLVSTEDERTVAVGAGVPVISPSGQLYVRFERSLGSDEVSAALTSVQDLGSDALADAMIDSQGNGGLLIREVRNDRSPGASMDQETEEPYVFIEYLVSYGVE